MQSTKSAARDRWPPYIGTPQVHTSAHSYTQFGGKETTTGTRILKAHHLRTYDDALEDLPRLEALSRERYVEPKTSGRVSLKDVIPSFVTHILVNSKLNTDIQCLEYRDQSQSEICHTWMTATFMMYVNEQL